MGKKRKKLQSDFPELLSENTADWTLIGDFADFDIPAYRAKENFFPPNIFSGFYHLETFL